jgi:hypothetical protein
LKQFIVHYLIGVLPVIITGIFVLLHFIPAPNNIHTQVHCTLEQYEPVIIEIAEADPAEWHGIFNLMDDPILWEPVSNDASLIQYQNSVQERTGNSVNSKTLIDRQRKIFAALSNEWKGEAENSMLMLEGTVGEIKPMVCLEAMLWKWQNYRFPMISYPTEFGAFILKRDTDLRIYLSSNDIVGARIRPEVMESIQTDIESGFVLFAHLHNHPFLFDRKIGDRMWTMEETIEDIAGALAPSMTDVSFYRGIRDRFGLQEAWITNGFETSKFRAGEFDILIAR